MIIVGAKGFAKQLTEIIYQLGLEKDLCFFDNVSSGPKVLFGHPILTEYSQVERVFLSNNFFSLGVGGPQLRCKLALQFMQLGGQLQSVISPYANISRFCTVENGASILTGATVENDVSVKEGVLINTHASLHHDSSIGAYSEIAPGARVLGGCILEEEVYIGTNAVILPKLKVGWGVVVGAGAIVTKNVESNTVVLGNPARHLRYLT